MSTQCFPAYFYQERAGTRHKDQDNQSHGEREQAWFITPAGAWPRNKDGQGRRGHGAIPMSLCVASYLLRAQRSRGWFPYPTSTLGTPQQTQRSLNPAVSSPVPRWSSLHPPAAAHSPSPAHLGGGSLSSMVGPLSVSRAGLGRASPGTAGSPLAEKPRPVSRWAALQAPRAALSLRRGRTLRCAAQPSRTPPLAPGSG